MMPVDGPFADSLSDWMAFFALMGGAAATLLGLLFVAVSLRLNIFRQRNVRDIRDFAAFTLATYLVAMMVAGLVLAPHARQETVALPLLLIGLGGLGALGWVIAEWLRLDLPRAMPAQEHARQQHWGWVIMGALATPYLIVIAAALLLWQGSSPALGLLALAEASLLVVGTGATWLILSHAGNSPEDDGGA
jgi:hypothetical protein